MMFTAMQLLTGAIAQSCDSSVMGQIAFPADQCGVSCPVNLNCRYPSAQARILPFFDDVLVLCLNKGECADKDEEQACAALPCDF